MLGAFGVETRCACSYSLSVVRHFVSPSFVQVLNMPVVLEVIGVLEQTTVTAEELHVRLMTFIAILSSVTYGVCFPG